MHGDVVLQFFVVAKSGYTVIRYLEELEVLRVETSVLALKGKLSVGVVLMSGNCGLHLRTSLCLEVNFAE
jgi:hypothetical protein